MEKRQRIKVLGLSIALLAVAGIAISCGATIRPTVATGYDWAGTNKILVVGVSELKQSPDISRALTHKLFEDGLPVVRKDVNSVLDIYDVGRKENADVVAYGTLTKVDTYYGSGRSSTRGYNYPIKTVELELYFIETETRRRIWQGTGSLEDSGYVADEFLVNKLLAEMVDSILPQWKEHPRSKSDAAMLKIGDKAPLFEVSDVNGNLYALKDDVGKNIVVLNFWSLFCEQCKEKMRLMDDVSRRYGKKGVKIISVSLEGEPLADRIKSYVDDSGYDLTFLLDEYSNDISKVADPYKIPGTPSLYVIGKSGEIVFARSGHVTTDELSDVIESQLEKG